MRLNRSSAVLLAAAAVLATSSVRAQPEAGPGGPPLWEIGGFAFGVSQQAYPGSDQQVSRALALPYGIYRGRFFRADQETAGLRALKTDRFELDIGVAGAFGARSDRIEARRGMADLGTLVEFGPRVKWNLGEAAGGRLRLDLPLRGVFDLDDGGAHRGLVFEPELQYSRRGMGGWNWGASVGAIVSDQRLARTFYEVRPSEALPGRPAYAADAGLVAWRLSANASRPLGRDWRLFTFARIDSVAGAANEASPLVRRTTGASVGLGLSYTWLRSERRAFD